MPLVYGAMSRGNLEHRVVDSLRLWERPPDRDGSEWGLSDLGAGANVQQLRPFAARRPLPQAGERARSGSFAPLRFK